MAYFQTKNPDLGKFLRHLHERYWPILWPFGLFHGHLVYLWPFWYILCLFGIFSPV
jgi:hypothetical protein